MVEFVDLKKKKVFHLLVFKLNLKKSWQIKSRKEKLEGSL